MSSENEPSHATQQASNIELEAKIPPQKVTEKHKNLSQGSTTQR